MAVVKKSMHKPKLLYTPYPKATDNPYLRANVTLLEELGFEVIAEPANWADRGKFLLIHLLKRDIDSVVVNWHENLFRRRDGRLNWMGIPVYLVSLLLFRVMSRRLIYIRHNLYPHSFTNEWKRSLAKSLVALGQRIAHVRATHSGHLKPEGFEYIPHTLYKTFSKRHLAAVDIGSDLPPQYFTLFGFIERYKRVDEVIRYWNSPNTLVIAGNCKDDGYLRELHELAKGKNVQFITRFIEEDEAQKLVGCSMGLIIAHADEDMIVSGSFFFGLSVATPLFAIRTPFLEWFQSSKPSPYLHLFDSLESLTQSLNSSESKSIKDDGALEPILDHFSNDHIRQVWSALLDLNSEASNSFLQEH